MDTSSERSIKRSERSSQVKSEGTAAELKYNSASPTEDSYKLSLHESETREEHKALGTLTDHRMNTSARGSGNGIT